MSDLRPQWLDVGEGAARRRIPYRRQRPKRRAGPGVFWLCGFNSVMTGTKASALAEWAGPAGRGCLRFDYSGHGQSEGRLVDGTIGRWLAGGRRAARGPGLPRPAGNWGGCVGEGRPPPARRQIEDEGVYLRPSRYGDGPY